jgi:hypothetical protein
MPKPRAILHKGTAFEGAMTRLPSRFPVGTHYIVEGEPGKDGQLRIISRYLVMPNGVRYDLMTPAERMGKPADLAESCHSVPTIAQVLFRRRNGRRA